MIERIVRWCAEHRAIVIALFLLISAIGVWSVMTTPLDAIPDLSENQVIVFTEYMGRSPQIVEDQITFPLVTALQGMPRVKAVRAQSMFGMSFVYVIFEDDAETYWARARVLERLATVQRGLPVGVQPQLGPDGTGVGHVFWYTLEGGGLDVGTLRALQDWYVKPQLQSVEGVAEVASSGGFIQEYQVNADPRKLQRYGISLADVSNAIMRSNNAVGGKLLETNGTENLVRGQGYLTTTAEFGAIVVASPVGVPLHLSDVADITLGGAARRGSMDRNGEGEVTGGIVVMRTGENAKAVIDRVKEKLASIATGFPPGVHVVTTYDRSDLINASVHTLVRTLLEEGLIVSLVVLLFLFHIPSTIRILIEIPISVLIAFILMRMFGISSNIMSLGGIAIGIGVLVDASIVMLENAHRHLAEAQHLHEHEGVAFSYSEVVIRSAQQVARAIFFSILIIVVSFLPVFLLTGQEGKLFHPLAFTKTFSLLGSAIVSITLVPVLMTLLMRGRFRTEDSNPLSRFFRGIYRPLLQWALSNRKTAIGLNVGALLAAIPVAISLGSEFMPPLDEGSLLFMPTLLPSTSVFEATRIMQKQDAIIRAYPEVQQVLGKVGKAETATDPAPVSMIESIILLKPHEEWRKGITKDSIIRDLSRELRMPGVALGWTQPIINRVNMLTTGVRTDIGLKIFGPNLDTLERLAIQAEQLLQPIPGAVDVVAERTQAGSYLDISLRPEAAQSYGISPGYINSIIEGAIGGIDAGTVVAGRSRFPITVRYQAGVRNTVEALRDLPIPVTIATLQRIQSPSASAGGYAAMSDVTSAQQSDGMGGSMGGSSATNSTSGSAQPAGIASQGAVHSLLDPVAVAPVTNVPLSALADITIKPGPPMISSENAMLRSIVYMNVRGRDMGGFVEEAKRVLASQLPLPVGYSVMWSGQYEQQVHARQRLMVVVPLVFVLIFVLLLFTLKDVKEAGVVMLSVPFALIGGVYLIWLLQYNWSVAVWVGFIALYGVATETGVVMVVYLHEALDQKIRAARQRSEVATHTSSFREFLTESDIQEATMEGAVLRLRPKLMTVATAMMGLIPIMFSTGVGADVMRPIAAPMIGGMLTSAIHVLIVTPVIFFVMKRDALRRGTLKESAMAGWMQH